MSRGGLARDVAAVVAVGVTVTHGAVLIADEKLDTALFRFVTTSVDGSGLGVVPARQRLMTSNAFPPPAGLMDDLHVTLGHPLHLPQFLDGGDPVPTTLRKSEQPEPPACLPLPSTKRQQTSLVDDRTRAVGRFRLPSSQSGESPLLGAGALQGGATR